jgi:hypothetical protein
MKYLILGALLLTNTCILAAPRVNPSDSSSKKPVAKPLTRSVAQQPAQAMVDEALLLKLLLAYVQQIERQQQEAHAAQQPAAEHPATVCHKRDKNAQADKTFAQAATTLVTGMCLALNPATLASGIGTMVSSVLGIAHAKKASTTRQKTTA